MAASNTRFTQNSLGQSKTPIDSDHGIYRDLRDVVAKYAFERSHRFPVIQPNSGRRDYSRLSCGEDERLASFLRDSYCNFNHISVRSFILSGAP